MYKTILSFILFKATISDATPYLQSLSDQLNVLEHLILNKHEANIKKIQELQKQLTTIEQRLTAIDKELDTIPETKRKIDQELDEALTSLTMARNALK
jgi:Mg2+ and Co2+ transporter CorA